MGLSRTSTLASRKLLVLLGFAASTAFFPVVANAQSAIAGQVTDASGGVLPGVTVEAASPALIEGARSAVTDAQGRYAIEPLRPGVYKVTFTLTGFSTLVRDGVELAANFTAPINAQMSVGGVEETITVTGQSPVVDVQRTAVREVMSHEQLETLPTGRTLASVGMIVPAMRVTAPDVGGTQGMQQTQLSIHGSQTGDNSFDLDGMNINCSSGSGPQQCNYPDDGAYQEVVYTVVGGTADSQTSGVRISVVPKEGGNTFRGMGTALYSNRNFYTQNYNDDLKNRGLRAPGHLDNLSDYNGQIGGPIKKDKLWFFQSDRVWRTNLTIPDTFDENGNLGVDDNLLKSYLVRLTSNLSSANKLALYYARTPRFRGHRLEPGTEPKASIRSDTWDPHVAQVKLTSTVSSRTLLEAGWSQNRHFYRLFPQPEVKLTDISRQDLLLLTVRNAPTAQESHRFIHADNLTGTMSYITGTHAFKSGIQYRWGFFDQKDFMNGNLIQQYRNGVPFQVTVFNTPIDKVQRDYVDVGVYAQDSWTRDRMTINGGLRFDYFRGFIPDQTSPAGRFVPARSFPGKNNLPNWKNWSPRLGLSYDLFGNAKTALKFSVGRYVAQDNVAFVSRYAPLSVQSDQRTWTDPNGDDLAQDSEIGPPRNAAFGLAAGTNTADPNIARTYNMIYNVAVQHEILRGMSLTASYYHRQYYNLSWTNNLATTFNDYTLVAIRDPRGNGGTIPVYNLNSNKVGAVSNFDTSSDQNTRRYDGYDITLNTRFGRGGTLLTGFSSGLTKSRTCQVANPNSLLFCDQNDFDIPFQTQFKLAGSYPLPWDVLVSGVLQSVAGNERPITYIVTRTDLPQLTVSSVTIPLLPPGSEYYDRLNQLDLRLAKNFRFRAKKIMPQVDIFNVTNSATVLSQINTFGPSLDQVRTILDGRIVRVGVMVEF